MSKDLINTGVAGDSSTGDNLFTGGTKINTMFQEVYNAFGKVGANPQIIHATGYWQTPTRASYTFPVAIGSQLNVDTRNGSLVVKLPNGKIGEMVKLRDVYGSWENSPCVVRADGLEQINSQLGDITFDDPFSELTFVCTNDTPGFVNWTYSHRFLNNKEVPITPDTDIIDKVYEISSSTPITFPLGATSSFVSIKLMLAGLQLGGASVTASDVHLAHDGTTHVYTESSVLNTGSSRVYDVDFSIQSGNVMMTISTTLSSAKVHILSTAKTKILI